MSKFNPVIKTCEDVTLIKLMNVPSDMVFIGEVFGKIAELSVDVNMISLSEKVTVQFLPLLSRTMILSKLLSIHLSSKMAL